MSAVSCRTLTPGSRIEQHLEDVARLRIRVFHEWPYLYVGDMENERTYLSTFVTSSRAVCVAAFDGDAMVGAATGLPLADEHGEFVAPFVNAGIDITRIFYCAESVLLPAYRGQGLYRRFMEGRESHARALGGFDTITFCGVVRPDHHPLKPADAAPLDPIWRRFGYAPRPDLICRFSWLDIGEAEETEKPLQFWIKTL